MSLRGAYSCFASNWCCEGDDSVDEALLGHSVQTNEGD